LRMTANSDGASGVSMMGALMGKKLKSKHSGIVNLVTRQSTLAVESVSLLKYGVNTELGFKDALTPSQGGRGRAAGDKDGKEVIPDDKQGAQVL